MFGQSANHGDPPLAPGGRYFFFAALLPGGRRLLRLALVREVGAVRALVGLDVLEAPLRVPDGVELLAGDAAVGGACGHGSLLSSSDGALAEVYANPGNEGVSARRFGHAQDALGRRAVADEDRDPGPRRRRRRRRSRRCRRRRRTRRAAARGASVAAWKIRGSGFSMPTSAESRTNSSSGARPAVLEQAADPPVGVGDDRHAVAALAQRGQGLGGARPPRGTRGSRADARRRRARPRRRRSSGAATPRPASMRVEVERNPLGVGRLRVARGRGGAPRRTPPASARRKRAGVVGRARPRAQTRSPSTWMSVPPASKRTARTPFTRGPPGPRGRPPRARRRWP